jgi:CrcB protein
MSKLILVFLGSGIGGVLRYVLSGWAQRLGNGLFPLGTLAVNLLGCLAIGFLSGAFAGSWLLREEYRVAVVIGVLGGFTTFSAFGMETFALLNDGQRLRAAANVFLSVVLGLIVIWIGFRVAERWLGV